MIRITFFGNPLAIVHISGHITSKESAIRVNERSKLQRKCKMAKRTYISVEMMITSDSFPSNTVFSEDADLKGYQQLRDNEFERKIRGKIGPEQILLDPSVARPPVFVLPATKGLAMNRVKKKVTI